MDEWLLSIKLDRYATEIKEEGYDELEFLSGRNRQGVQGAHLNPLGLFLNPLGLFLRTSIPFIQRILSAFRPA